MSRLRHVFRWDLDKTYLKTEFDTVRDLVRMARLTAEQRENIPGSAALLRAIKASTSEPEAHAVYFLSGSPDLIRAVIEKKFVLDGFQPDGFALKPTLSDVMRGRFRAVRGQVAYKLPHLLHGRSVTPVGTPETLFGDDAENDAFIYGLYADVVAGRVDAQTVLEVANEAGAYPDQLAEIEEGMRSIVHENAVRRIVIHLDRATPPEEFEPFGHQVVPVSSHLQTAMVLAADGTLPAEVVRLVAQEMIERYGFLPGQLVESARALVARWRAERDEDLDRLADALADLDPAQPPPGAPGARPGSIAPTTKVLEGLSSALRSEPRRTPSPAPPRDFRKLWDREKARMELARRLRREEAAARAAAAPNPPQP